MYDYIFKYIIVGDSGCGKSSIANSFVNNSYNIDHDITIGVDFTMKICELDNDKKCKIQIWDTAGQEMFRSITKSYYKNTCVAIIVYDVTNRESFDNLVKWINDIKNIAPNIPKIIIVGNKIDLKKKREVSKKEGELFCNLYNFSFFETSVKKENSIENIFLKSSNEIYNKIYQEEIEPNKDNGITLISLPTSLPTSKNIYLDQINKNNFSKKCFPCF